jgi:hypothetical protein
MRFQLGAGIARQRLGLRLLAAAAGTCEKRQAAAAVQDASALSSTAGARHLTDNLGMRRSENATWQKA